MAVFRSDKHIYAQIIDDAQGRTVVSASSSEKNGPKGGNVAGAKQIGQLVADLAARALLAQARCLVKVGKKEEAIAVLT